MTMGQGVERPTASQVRYQLGALPNSASSARIAPASP